MTDELALAFARHRLEDELLRLLVEQEDRGRLGAEDRPRDVHDRLQQGAVLLLAAERPGRDRGAKRALVHHCPPVFEAVRYRRLLSCGGVSLGCFASMSAANAAMCGAAKLLPVARIVPPPGQATSTSMPRAKNSTGGRRVRVPGPRVVLLVAADRDHRREPPREALDRHVVRGRDDHRAAEVGAVGELVQRLGEPLLRRREAHVDHVEALLDGMAQTGEDAGRRCRWRRRRARGRCGARSRGRARG